MKIENKLRKLNKSNQVPLHLSAEADSKEIGELLISKGADVNTQNSIYN